ncbi:hypothetical protein [Chromobacterium sp. IRSSSOUMB001]|uniref:hypothetical protein n=1 Tax=Chromobacterium sp. IRSSSOUMB001 TaxID=2927123 RepID=UPI00193B3BF1|nr:hypothetical protein [Chromobacterium sp. IRSSSOUMB001]
MKKALLINFIVTAISVAVTSIYFLSQQPKFWKERLELKKFEVMSVEPTSVYEFSDLKNASFKVKKGDQCFYVSEGSFSFGEATPDLAWYKKLIILCPEKGIGWIENGK